MLLSLPARFGIVCCVGTIMSMSATSAVAHPGHAHESEGDDGVIVAQDTRPSRDHPPMREFDRERDGNRTTTNSRDLTNKVTIEERGEYRYITSNGIPDHKPGQFPNRGNPNRISAQSYEFRVPLHPTSAKRYTIPRDRLFGVAVNGVVFDPGTAEFWQNDRRSGWNYDALSGKINLGLDDHHAHVQPDGTYHYHGIPTGIVKAGGKDKMVLIGYAADGFPIYGPYAYEDAMDADSGLYKPTTSWQLKKGTRPDGDDGPGGKYDGTFVQDWTYVKGSGDLGPANERYGVTPEYPEGTVYYVLTETFPFVPRYFRGEPDESFRKHGMGPGGPGGPGGRGGPGGPDGRGRPPYRGEGDGEHRPPPRRGDNDRDGDHRPPPR